MKKEYVMMILILIIVISGHYLTQKKSSVVFQSIEKDLNELKTMVEEEETQDNLNARIKKIEDKWNDEYEILAYYTEHDELEKIGVQLSIINSTIKTKTNNDTFMEIDRCIFLIEHLEDKEDLKIVNMF